MCNLAVGPAQYTHLCVTWQYDQLSTHTYVHSSQKVKLLEGIRVYRYVSYFYQIKPDSALRKSVMICPNIDTVDDHFVASLDIS